MVRRKNVLATMMQSMAALAVVGVYWVVDRLLAGVRPVGDQGRPVRRQGRRAHRLELGPVLPQGHRERRPSCPGYDIPVYVHVMFQGMFAIITPALISGAIAERIRFWPFCLFMILWVTFVYCPLAHMVWAFDWFDPSVPGREAAALAAIGLLGQDGGTRLRRRHGRPHRRRHGRPGVRAWCSASGTATRRWSPTRTAWC